MHCFIVMYDLITPGQDYQRLHNAIKTYPRWGRITESTWAVVTDQDASQIRDYLLDYMDNNDRIMVIQSGQTAAWKNAKARNEWLQENLVL